MGYLFFKEEVGTVKVIGMLMIIGGLILINSTKTMKVLKKNEKIDFFQKIFLNFPISAPQAQKGHKIKKMKKKLQK